MTTRITVALLEGRYACPDQVKLFRRQFPEGVEVTREVCLAHAADVDWDWASEELLPLDGQEAYNKAIGSARRAYDEATASAWRVYKEATAPARRAYKEATASARRAYDEATASAWRVYKEATAPARRAYDEARADARLAYRQAAALAFADAVIEFGLIGA